MLGKNWFIEPSIDFELKKYVLLAWLQQGEKNVKDQKIYPFYSDLEEHLEELKKFRQEKNDQQGNWKKEIESIQGDPPKIIYKKHPADDSLLQEVEMIIDYSVGNMEQNLREVENLHRKIRYDIRVFPVGIIPVYLKEGYFFLLNADEIKVYDYSFQSVYNSARSFSIQASHIGDYRFSFSTTLENIKTEVTRLHEKYTVPATFVFESRLKLPVEETFLPIAQEMLLEILA
ncbi:MAG: hypothetical protein ACOZCO_16510 [Bacteroidota bacterium]